MSLTSCNNMGEAISCPETSFFVSYHSSEDSCNRYRNFEIISTYGAVKPRTYIDTGRKNLITTKMYFVWAFPIRPSTARTLSYGLGKTIMLRNIAQELTYPWQGVLLMQSVLSVDSAVPTVVREECTACNTDRHV
jgi:hypothetical protein